MVSNAHIAPCLQMIESVMEADLSKEDPRIYGMLTPFIKRGGKRIRPTLCLLSCGAVGGKYESIVQVASVIELFHNFTLIHDDIEDNSLFRRGESTLHVSHGIPLALNSGDALYTFLWRKLMNLELSSFSRLLRLSRLYADAFKRVVDGQGIEISWTRDARFDISEKEYYEMIGGKTSALIGLSCEAGALVGGADAKTRKALRSYGEKLGLAFQIQDDVLNLTGNFSKYQKEIGGDISEGKRSLIVVHFLKHASKPMCTRLVEILASQSKDKKDIEEAIALLKETGSIAYASKAAVDLVLAAKKKLDVLPDSVDKSALTALADYSISRES